MIPKSSSTSSSNRLMHCSGRRGAGEATAVGRRELRVCVVLNSLTVGGAETQLLKLCKSLDHSSIEFEVLYYGRIHVLLPDFRESSAKITFLDKDGLGRWRFVWRLSQYLRERQFDVVHCWLGTANQYGVLAAMMARCRCILTGHRSLDSPGWMRAWFDRSVSRWTVGRIVNSYAIRSVHNTRTGYPRAKIIVLHNGVEIEKVGPATPGHSTRRELGIPPHIPLLVHVGRLEDRVKRQSLLVQAVDQLVRRGRDVRAVFVGDGPDRAALEQTVSEKGLDRYVKFIGIRRDMRRVFSAADIAVCTSPEEGLPNVVLEPMAAGITVLTVSNGGGPELIGNPEQVVPRDDANSLAERIELVLDTPELAKRWNKAAQERVARMFSMSKAANRYRRILAAAHKRAVS